MKQFVSFVGLMALILSLTLGYSGGHAIAQDATPATNATACSDLADEQELVVTGATGQPVTEGSVTGQLVVIREVGDKTINVYADCLGPNETITPHSGFDIWSGYPSLKYAGHDACGQAVADQNDALTQGSWAFGKTVTLDDKPLPASCGSTSDPIFSTQDKEVVSAGTVVLQVAVDFTHHREDVRAMTLDKDTTTVFTSGYRLMQFVGYTDLAAAQADVCAQAQRDARTAALPKGWNAGFTITVDNGQPLSGCPAS